MYEVYNIRLCYINDYIADIFGKLVLIFVWFIDMHSVQGLSFDFLQVHDLKRSLEAETTI